MKLRTAIITDTKLLFDWANESSVRNNAINTNQIDWDDHVVWFEKKLENKNSFIFIAEINDTPIGQIRFDLENNKFIIDYSVAKEERGKGYGFQIVKKGIDYIRMHVSYLPKFISLVRPENTASRKIFEKLGISTKSSLFKGETELIVYELM